MTPQRRAAALAFALAVVASLSLTGCGSWLAGSGGTKAGGAPVPVVLRLGTVESGHPPYRFFVEEFARQVEKRSHGGIHVDVSWEVNTWSPHSEAELVDVVGSGGVDIALLPDRIMSHAGPSALDALHTPFLVDSMALADAITAGEVGASMLADLPIAGAVGLAMAPEDLRHPAGYERGLTTAADFDGLRVRTPQIDDDPTGEAVLLRALGSQPQSSTDYGAALRNGTLDGAETAYPLFADFPAGMTYTANLTFFAKINVLVASRVALDRLPAGGEQIVRAAAESARDLAAAQRPSEEADLTAVCLYGHDAVLAPAAEIAALAERAAPVARLLRENPKVAASIDAIEELKAASPAPQPVIPEICGPPTGDSARPRFP